jgi:hypothetical protein
MNFRAWTTIFVLESAVLAFPDESYQDSHRCAAKGIHLSQGNDVDENGHVSMTVSFFIVQECGVDTYPVVYYRPAEGGGNSSVAHPRENVSEFDSYRPNPISFTYVNTRKKINYKSDWIYHVELPGLMANTTYWYKIISLKAPLVETNGIAEPPKMRKVERGRGRSTSRLKFSTPPKPGSPVSVALVADLGYFPQSVATMTSVWEDDDSSHVIIGGDISYAAAKGERWMEWFQIMEPLFREKTLSVAAGNHEVECDTDNWSVFTYYENLFHNPNRIAKAIRIPITPEYVETLDHQSCVSPHKFQSDYQFGNSFYAYTYGSLKIIVLNSYTDCTPGSVQFEWLVDILKNVDRTITPWIMVVMHAPIYNTFHTHRHELEANKEAVEQVFYQYHVNIVVSGHNHAYLRTMPVYNGVLHEDAPIHVTVGTGGSWEGPPTFGYRFKDAPEPFIATRRLDTVGYANLKIVNATHALWDFRSNSSPLVWNWNSSVYTEDSEQNRLERSKRGVDVGGYFDRNNRFRDLVWLTNLHV